METKDIETKDIKINNDDNLCNVCFENGTVINTNCGCTMRYCHNCIKKLDKTCCVCKRDMKIESLIDFINNKYDLEFKIDYISKIIALNEKLFCFNDRYYFNFIVKKFNTLSYVFDLIFYKTHIFYGNKVPLLYYFDFNAEIESLCELFKSLFEDIYEEIEAFNKRKCELFEDIKNHQGF